MKSIIGLAEYTLTGGFLWILFLVFATLNGMERQDLGAVQVWAAWLNDLPKLQSGDPALLLKDSIPAAVTGVMLNGIFATGLMLDLVAPFVFVAFEIGWTKKWLLRDPATWFTDLIAQHGGLVSKDYQALSGSRNLWRPAISQVGEYRCLMLFLISYVLGSSSAGQQEVIFDRMKLWRVSRALSVSLLVLSTLLTLWFFFQKPEAHEPTRVLYVGIAAPWVVLAISCFMVRTSFSRLMVSIQATAYLAWKKSLGTNSEPSSAGHELAGRTFGIVR